MTINYLSVPRSGGHHGASADDSEGLTPSPMSVSEALLHSESILLQTEGEEEEEEGDRRGKRTINATAIKIYVRFKFHIFNIAKILQILL